MNMKITPPGVGSAGTSGVDEFGILKRNYSTQSFFNHDASKEIDRLIIESEQLKEEVQGLNSVIIGLLSEIDLGESL
ncbi:MAG: hypothetical protein KZQ92_16220 [Candidatus Thiodiazotropha sp. (ex Lucinoma borealis)]|nr:hypothetical protein [Candidatus Thiodiazotropha sp. (ex Lucinoma borealis)]